MPTTAEKRDSKIRDVSGPAVVLFITQEHWHEYNDPIATHIRRCKVHARSNPGIQQYAVVGSVVAAAKKASLGRGSAAFWANHVEEALTFDGLYSTTSW